MKTRNLLPLLGGLLLLARTCSFAESDSTDPIRVPIQATTVSPSTSSWTAVPTTDTSGRTLVHLSNPSGNSASFAVVISSLSATPAEATTVRPFELEPGEGMWLLMPPSVYAYAMSLHTSTESIHVQEFKQ